MHTKIIITLAMSLSLFFPHTHAHTRLQTPHRGTLTHSHTTKPSNKLHIPRMHNHRQAPLSNITLLTIAALAVSCLLADMIYHAKTGS